MSIDDMYAIQLAQQTERDELEHKLRMQKLQVDFDYSMFNMLQPSIEQDGDMWCVCYGEDLQTGICGFGKTPHLAVLDWNKAWHNEARASPEFKVVEIGTAKFDLKEFAKNIQERLDRD